MNQVKPVYVQAFIKVQAGEFSYPLNHVAVNEQGDIDAALNQINQDLKDNYIGDGQVHYAMFEDEDVSEWKKGFWQDGQHTIYIKDYQEISKNDYEVMKKNCRY